MTGEVVSYSGPGPGDSKDENGPNVSQSSESPSYPFQSCVDWEKIDSSCITEKNSVKKKMQAKTIEEIQQIVEAGKLNELKSCIRNSQWLPNDGIRARLWQVIKMLK